MEPPAYDPLAFAYAPDDPLAFTIEYAPGATPFDLGFYFIKCRQCDAEFMYRERGDGWRAGLRQAALFETDRSARDRPFPPGAVRSRSRATLNLRYELAVHGVALLCSCGWFQIVGVERLSSLPAFAPTADAQCACCGSQPVPGVYCRECILIDALFGSILSLVPLPDFLKLS